MYIQVSVDLQQYQKDVLDLRLSDHITINRLIDITWQVAEISQPSEEGGWIRIVNKKKVVTGNSTLEENGITSGDKIEIL